MPTSEQAHPLISFTVVEKYFHVPGAVVLAACSREGCWLAWEPLEPCKLKELAVIAGLLLGN